MQRLRQILAVFAKYGFADVVERMNLSPYLPSRLAQAAAAHSDLSTPERLRLAFEELGPTFVKLGQLLSTRPDLVPDAYIVEFTRLQDNVAPLPFAAVSAVFEREFSRSVDEAFLEFNRTPLASASISQVHEATLHTGEKVVVKIQRPEIKKGVDTDISILAFMAGLLEKYVPESRIVAPKIVVEEFFRTLSFELDFRIEANNTLRAAQNLASIPEIVIPRVYKNLSGERILTLQKLEGVRVNDLKGLDAAGIDRKVIVALGARSFFKSVMIDGYFHGDLHGGNLFVLPGNRLGIIDFGIVGRLGEKSRDQLASMVMALLAEDYETLCYQYAELGQAGPGIDFDGFQREVRNTLAPYMGLSLGEMNAGKILVESTKIATKYQIRIPGDWMLVFKVILTIEGMGRTLDPQFDLLAHGREMVRDLVKNQYSVQRLSRDALWMAKDFAGLFQSLPRQLRWMLRKFGSNDFAIEVRSPELAQIRRQLNANGHRMSLSILGAGLFIASALVLPASDHQYRLWDVPVVTAGYFLFSIAVFVRVAFGRFGRGDD